jgi:hypothetical protein
MPQSVTISKFFLHSVRQTASVLALMGEPKPGATMPTDPKRVKAIFLDAVEEPDQASRGAFLDRACAGDAELRARVEVLIRCHDTDQGVRSDPVEAAGQFLPAGPGTILAKECGGCECWASVAV